MYSEDLKRAQDARAVIERFLSAGGKSDPQFLDTHAAVLIRLGAWEEAVDKLSKCLARVGASPTRAVAHYRMACALLAQGDASEAVRHAREALDLAARMGGLTEAEATEARRLSREKQPDRADRSP